MLDPGVRAEGLAPDSDDEQGGHALRAKEIRQCQAPEKTGIMGGEQERAPSLELGCEWHNPVVGRRRRYSGGLLFPFKRAQGRPEPRPLQAEPDCEDRADNRREQDRGVSWTGLQGVVYCRTRSSRAPMFQERKCVARQKAQEAHRFQLCCKSGNRRCEHGLIARGLQSLEPLCLLFGELEVPLAFQMKEDETVIRPAKAHVRRKLENCGHGKGRHTEKKKEGAFPHPPGSEIPAVRIAVIGLIVDLEDAFGFFRDRPEIDGGEFIRLRSFVIVVFHDGSPVGFWGVSLARRQLENDSNLR
jgi:hypothetical protein